jgi:hypothetical protein
MSTVPELPCRMVNDTLLELSKVVSKCKETTMIPSIIKTLSRHEMISDGIKSELFMRISEINNGDTFIGSLVSTVRTFVSLSSLLGAKEKNKHDVLFKDVAHFDEKLLILSFVIFQNLERYGIHISEIY